VPGVDGWVRENGSRAVLRLARHQYSIHCESSRVAQGAGKRRWAPQTTRGTLKGEIEYKRNETELLLQPGCYQEIAFSVCSESLHASICLLTFQIMLLDVFIAIQRIFLVVEAARHGTLSHIFKGYHYHSDQDYLEEWQARPYFHLLMAGMEHLHSQGITHRLVTIG